MKLDKKKAFKVFFGTSEFPEGIVIITPINKIYKRIQDRYHFIEESNGWWQRAKARINLTPITILKIPQGSCIKDCLQVFDYKKIKKVIFLGFCGSLNWNIKIGETVIPHTAIFRNLKVVVKNEGEERYKIKTVLSMISESVFFKKLTKNKINLLDMETYFLYRWGSKYKTRVVSLLIVTDQPTLLPFFLCTEKEVRMVNRSISRIVNRIDQYL